MVEIQERWSSDEKNKINEMINGSYSDFVRLERRNLLLVSSVTIISLIAAISPDKVSVAGINFENFTPTSYYFVLLLLIIYFMAAFWIFSFPKYQEIISVREKVKKNAITLEYSVPWYSAAVALFKLSDAKFLLWISIHYYLPIAIGSVAFLVALAMVISGLF